MIVTVTLNPMLDKTVYVSRVRRGKIERASEVTMTVGGKGVNVSRQLKVLGCPTLAMGCWGGEVADLLERLLEAEGISHSFIRVGGRTREGVTYRESDGTMTAVFEPPHNVTRKEAGLLVAACRRRLRVSSWVVCSGSSPCTQADDVFARILLAAARAGVPSVLDSYGEALRLGLAGRPTMVKFNRSECELTYGRRTRTIGDLRTLCRQIFRGGASCCVVTDGPRPAFGLSRSGIWKIIPPRVKTVNPTGSGDGMLAGILYGMVQGWAFDSCLAYGAAAGAANAERWEVASSSKRRIGELLRAVVVRRIR